jgi:hypothetical protein
MKFFKRDLVEKTNKKLADCRADVVAMPYAQNTLPGFALQEQGYHSKGLTPIPGDVPMGAVILIMFKQNWKKNASAGT